MREWPLPSQQRCARRRANRHAGDGVDELNALALKPVEVRRLDVGIASVTERLRPPLVREHKQDVRRARASPASGCLALIRTGREPQRQEAQWQARQDKAGLYVNRPGMQDAQYPPHKQCAQINWLERTGQSATIAAPWGGRSSTVAEELAGPARLHSEPPLDYAFAAEQPKRGGQGNVRSVGEAGGPLTFVEHDKADAH